MRTWWVACVILTAGCLSPDPGPEQTNTQPNVGRDASPTVWTDCTQWHLHFDARAEDFATEVPPGFTVAADPQGLTTLLIHTTFCGDAREALIAVPVIAPAAYEDTNRTELAVLQVFHDGHGPELYPAPFAPRLITATFSKTTSSVGPTLTVSGGGETFDLRVTLAPSSGTFAAERWARFAHDGAALGILTADGNTSATRGFGTVAYTHQGPGGAPPATAGIAHIVDRLDLTFHKETTP